MLFKSIVALALLVSGAAQAGESPLHFIIEESHHVDTHRIKLNRSTPGAHVVKASWYGGSGERLNHYTASGEPFRAMARIAAHRSLAFGTRLEVTNLSNGRSTIVRVVDRGPASWTGRDLDLSRGAAGDLGMLAAGEARVSFRIVN